MNTAISPETDHSLTVIKTFLTDSPSIYPPGLLSHLIDCSDKDTDAYLIKLLGHQTRTINQSSSRILLTRHPWLRLTPTPPSSQAGDYSQQHEGLVWVHLSRAVARFVDRHHADPGRYSSFVEIPGLHHLLVDTLNHHGQEAEANKFAQRINLDQRYSRSELLFAPTYGCNLSCSYCYAKGWEKRFNLETTPADLVRLMDWMRQQGLTVLSLAGGEPTTYTGFARLCALATARQINITIASNMLYPGTIATLLRPDLITLVTAHYDQSFLSSPARHELFLKNISALLARDIPVRLRYTLTSASTSDEWYRIFSLLDTLGLQELHFAPTFLNFDGNNCRATDQDGTREKAISRMIDFCEAAKQRDLMLHLCKPVALCLFPVEKRNEYLEAGIIRNACVAMAGDCSRNITVNPDLSTFPCNALAEKGPKITSFPSISAAGQYFREYITDLVQKPFLPPCNDCFFHATGFCQQVCLVEKQASLTS